MKYLFFILALSFISFTACRDTHSHSHDGETHTHDGETHSHGPDGTHEHEQEEFVVEPDSLQAAPGGQESAE